MTNVGFLANAEGDSTASWRPVNSSCNVVKPDRFCTESLTLRRRRQRDGILERNFGFATNQATTDSAWVVDAPQLNPNDPNSVC
jgi:hypothetical protein